MTTRRLAKKQSEVLKTTLRLFIALVWLINGVYCKLLMQVPRHRDIVAAILGASHADVLTRLIGLGELTMAIWIMSGWRRGVCGVAQVFLIAVMNMLEIALVPHLLLFGWRNGLLALALIAGVGYAFKNAVTPERTT